LPCRWTRSKRILAREGPADAIPSPFGKPARAIDDDLAPAGDAGREPGGGFVHELSLHRDPSDLLARSEPLSGVARLAEAIRDADGLIVASPECVRSIPGGLKNAIDWLVSRDELTAKPIALAHASHRGDDMLGQLRLVLGMVSQNFRTDFFLRFPLMGRSEQEIDDLLSQAAR
jgi:hypothetical protein